LWRERRPPGTRPEKEVMSIATPALDFDRDLGQPEIVVTDDGHVKHEALTDSERTYALLMHLSPIVAWIVLGPFTFLAPLVMWLIRRNASVFADDHGREATNFSISFLLYHVLLGITIVGLLAFPILWIIMLINQIRAAIAAGNSEYFRYPLTIRFLS
jgi:uncharacterized Tic20 family protein